MLMNSCRYLRQRRRQLPQVGGWSANDAGKLTESPVRRDNRFFGPWQHKMQPFGAVIFNTPERPEPPDEIESSAESRASMRVTA